MEDNGPVVFLNLQDSIEKCLLDILQGEFSLDSIFSNNASFESRCKIHNVTSVKEVNYFIC